MSRSKREKKSSGIKIWFPILCVAIVGITFFMIYDLQNKIDKKNIENTITNEVNNNVKNENSIENEIISENEFNTNNVVNEVSNRVDNTVSNNTLSNKTQNSNINFAPSTPGITDKKQKAIELVKKEWGADDTVNYMFDYVNENGEYVIAVKDKSSATVKYYFRVNLETETVELD